MTSLISVLMPVYNADKYISEAINSILSQTIEDYEFVIVNDGSTDGSRDIIEEFNKRDKRIKVVDHRTNKGTAEALKSGLNVCRGLYIARMDADDISREDRLDKQMKFLREHSGIDVVGSWIAEFKGNKNNICARRKVPVDHDGVVKYAKYRNPLNHVTVMFRKKAVLSAGNYGNNALIQDYVLWAKMLLNGSKFANIPDYLVYVRAGDALIKRRGGLAYAKKEYAVQRELRRIGFIDTIDFIRNVIIRSSVRMMPYGLRGIIYRSFLRG